MRLSRVLLLAAGLAPVFAQFPGIPNFPGAPKGGSKNDSRGRRGRDSRNDSGQAALAPPGVPVPADSPLFDAFRKLEQQTAYHQRMTITTSDPQMAQVMTQMGFAPMETITAGDAKQVSLRVKLPLGGQVEDMELRTVSRNGRMAKKWISPGSGRFLKEVDASIAQQLAQAEATYASSIARNIAAGPAGWAAAGMESAAAAMAPVQAAQMRKTVHDFFEWTCMDGGAKPSPEARRELPPLTDLKVLGDQTLDGVAVTAYEFYVLDRGRPQGPMQMHIAKDSGLPMRMGMSEPRMGGGMQMDYFGFNQGDFEIPGCLGGR